jgi:hypothetical protein
VTGLTAGALVCAPALLIVAGGALAATRASTDADAPSHDAQVRIPPDPPPMRERAQWVFDLRYDRGEVYLLEVHRLDLSAPQETPRAMGRFALELFEGPTLIERVRFDFPLLGDEPRDGGLRTVPYFGKKLSTRIGVMFPASSRGTKLELLDRATDRRYPLPWPPTDFRFTAHDAGEPDAFFTDAEPVR